MAPEPAAVTLAGLIGPEMVDVHVKVVPTIVEVGVKLNAPPLQIVLISWVAVFVITGTGLTVTTTTIGAPGQPLALGVIVYVAVPVLMPSVLVRT
jgi:hypothetical protein